MTDFEKFTRVNDKPLIVIAEVKRRTCKLNGPWTKPESQNMQRMLRAIGVFPDDQLQKIASDLYDYGYHEEPAARITLLCMGSMKNDDLSRKYPKVPQITWKFALSFIYNRFYSYRNQKVAHPQWDENGKKLWDAATRSSDVENFIQRIDVCQTPEN